MLNRSLEKLFFEEPFIYQVWERFPLEVKSLPDTVKIRWFINHWEVNKEWEANTSDKEFIAELQIEVIRLMVRHCTRDFGDDKRKAYLASQATLYDNYNCSTCKQKSKGCESRCVYAYIRPLPQDMAWEGETVVKGHELDELGIPREVTEYIPGEFEPGQFFEKYIDMLEDFPPDMKMEIDVETGEMKIDEDCGHPLSKHAADNAEGWGASEDSDLVEIAIQELIQEQEMKGQSFGSMPAGIVEEIKKKDVVKQDLRRFIQGVKGKIKLHRKNSYTKINRRFDWLSGKKKAEGPKILICLDTSCSMTNRDMAKVFNIIETLRSKAELYISYCDTEVTAPVKLPKRATALNAEGRGGTNLNPVLKYSDGYNYTILVTDGDMPLLNPTERQRKTIGILLTDEHIYNRCCKDSDFNNFKLGFIKDERNFIR